MKNFSSSDYWQNRYTKGDNSGAGSYGKLAKFKAKTLNKFVKKNGIKTVVEFGCGDGNQLKLASYPLYIGYDVSKESIKLCKTIFASDKSKQFYWMDDIDVYKNAELALSLDVIFHLIEDNVYEKYMKQLFSVATKYVIIYSSNSNEQAAAKHVKHRKFTEWINVKEPMWELFHIIPNKFPFDPEKPDTTSFADFYFYKRKV